MPKKKKTDETAEITGMFGEPKPAPEKEPTSVEDQIKALTDSVADLTKANEGLLADHKKQQDLTMTLLAAPAPATPAVITAVPNTGLPTADLPDPVEDPKGHAIALNKLIADGVASQMTQFRADADKRTADDTTRTNQVNSLWERFSESHPELAEHRSLVSVAAQEVVDTARAKGIDGERFMFGAGSERFLEEVAENVTASIEAIRGEGEGGKDPKKAPKKGGDQPDPALGVLPGLPVSSSGGGGDGKDGDPGDGPGGLVSDIREGQRKDGFF